MSSDEGRGKGAPWGLLREDTHPMHEGCTLMTHRLVPTPGVGVSISVWGAAHSVPRSMCDAGSPRTPSVVLRGLSVEQEGLL